MHGCSELQSISMTGWTRLASEVYVRRACFHAVSLKLSKFSLDTRSPLETSSIPLPPRMLTDLLSSSRCFNLLQTPICCMFLCLHQKGKVQHCGEQCPGAMVDLGDQVSEEQFLCPLDMVQLPIHKCPTSVTN